MTRNVSREYVNDLGIKNILKQGARRRATLQATIERCGVPVSALSRLTPDCPGGTDPDWRSSPGWAWSPGEAWHSTQPCRRRSGTRRGTAHAAPRLASQQ